MKAFLLVFEPGLGDRDTVTAALDKIPEISYWYACFQSCVFFTSHLSANTLDKRIEKLIPIKGMPSYLIIEAGPDRQGLLPPAAWHLFNHPEKPRMPKQKP